MLNLRRGIRNHEGQRNCPHLCVHANTSQTSWQLQKRRLLSFNPLPIKSVPLSWLRTLFFSKVGSCVSSLFAAYFLIQLSAMAFGVGRGMTAPLAVINFILYVISACLAGSILNRNLDGKDAFIGNNVTDTFLTFALIASVVGIASTLAGAHHLRLWRTETLAAAAATSLIAWLLTLLAMGVACKEIHTGGYRTKRLKTLEAFMIILSLFELLYLLATHAGAVTRDANGPSAGQKVPAYGV